MCTLKSFLFNWIDAGLCSKGNCEPPNMECIQFLNEMIASMKRNTGHAAQGHRFEQDMKLICTYMRIISGKLAYESLSANTSPAVPSSRSINRYIYRSRTNVIKGVVRGKELKDHMLALNAEPFVNLSEDATRINGRVKYVAKQDRISGFCLPIDGDGMPITRDVGPCVDSRVK